MLLESQQEAKDNEKSGNGKEKGSLGKLRDRLRGQEERTRCFRHQLLRITEVEK